MDPVALAYLSLAVASFSVSIIMGRLDLILMAGIMIVSWAASNDAVMRLGFEGAPTRIPVIDAMLAVPVYLVARFGRRRAAYAVFGLFVMEEIVHVTMIYIHAATSLGYIVTLNVIFAMQCLVIGGAGVRTGLVDRDAPRRGRPYLARYARARSGEGVAKETQRH